MTKTPSALKWLAEKRARLAHDVGRTSRLATELQERHALLLSQLAALDATIKLYDESIEPTSIAPVVAQGRHGKRGVIRKALLGYMAESSPEWVSSIHLEQQFLADFDVSFASGQDRIRWRRNILGAALRQLFAAGVVERLHQPADGARDVGFWRLRRAAATTLADL